MFRFSFDIDDAEDSGFGPVVGPDTAPAQTEQGQLENSYTVAEHSASQVSLDDLLSSLPHTISFSPLSISRPSGHDVVLSRRDLFDARFQLISADHGAGMETRPSEVEFIDAPSDLVPGVYEGGLKTWECSLDLVACLSSIYGSQIAKALQRKRILELGCGTAAPSLYLIHSIFSAEPSTDARVQVHLQDYNELVLRLVTLPNIILSWYMSPASSKYRSSSPAGGSESNDDDEPAPLPPADLSQPGELALTPELKTAFLESLQAHGIHLKLFSGSWSTFDVERAGGPYDVLLTSETIYRTASLGSLVDLMRRATAPTTQAGSSASLEDSASRLSLSDSEDLKVLAGAPYLCLVAAKLVYFGVGGGANEFIEAVENSTAGLGPGGERSSSQVQTVWETNKGVKRSIMRVVWGP
ncbi:hypothetical protein GSI_02413 [Ganoderma sinense ZZ0214-1]|uniref:protein-histidine N-methyltransferase n=1 Tax=Ganoderma sinense ZZ0214-1 TaxID=1077348 RepID=A0A2G8SPN1_9APHY|nr:hypothetical protein GSI_02413 [Ganoderma sinense ZZ0214-1]